MKHLFTLGGVVVALGFVVVFFSGRIDSKPLAEVAPRVGMSEGDLTAMVPRIATQTGATLGTSRRVVYLLACSGVPNRATIEQQATLAASRARQQHISAREATLSVLKTLRPQAASALLGDC